MDSVLQTSRKRLRDNDYDEIVSILCQENVRKKEMKNVYDQGCKKIQYAVKTRLKNNYVKNKGIVDRLSSVNLEEISKLQMTKCLKPCYDILLLNLILFV